MDFCQHHVLCFLDVMFIIAVTFLVVVGNIGNLLVFILTPSFRNGHGIILVSLSFADLGSGAIAALSVYPAATFLGTQEAWLYGDTACLMATYFGQVFRTNSGTALTLLSIERYIAVAHPLKYSRIVTKKLTLVCVAFSWLGSIAGYITLLTGYTASEYVPVFYSCMPVYFGNPVSAALLFFGIDITDCIVLLVTSCIVSWKLKVSARRRANMAHISNPSQSQDSHSTGREGATTVRTLKLLRMVKVMALAVFVCWLPFCCIAFLTVFFIIEPAKEISFYAYWILQSNGFVNTVIYFLMNKTYHDRLDELFKGMVPRVFVKQSERQNYTGS